MNRMGLRIASLGLAALLLAATAGAQDAAPAKIGDAAVQGSLQEAWNFLFRERNPSGAAEAIRRADRDIQARLQGRSDVGAGIELESAADGVARGAVTTYDGLRRPFTLALEAMSRFHLDSARGAWNRGDVPAAGNELLAALRDFQNAEGWGRGLAVTAGDTPSTTDTVKPPRDESAPKAAPRGTPERESSGGADARGAFLVGSDAGVLVAAAGTGGSGSATRYYYRYAGPTFAQRWRSLFEQMARGESVKREDVEMAFTDFAARLDGLHRWAMMDTVTMPVDTDVSPTP